MLEFISATPFLTTCQNPMVVDFWNENAEKCTGEASLVNMTSYITAKLDAFIYNGVVRSVVGQSESTVNFRQAMDRRKIVLVNLSKGTLGEMNTQLLGMLLVGKLFGAALSRTDQRPEHRTPFYLYLDEWQHVITDTAAHMTAEARKFGLCLILANQNLGQLSAHYGLESVAEAVLGNVGSLVCFRLGPPDAKKMESYTSPEFSAQDLQYLPDYHAAAKLLVHNAPTRPFVFRSDPHVSPAATKELAAAVACSKNRYSVPLAQVEKEIAARRLLAESETV